MARRILNRRELAEQAAAVAVATPATAPNEAAAKKTSVSAKPRKARAKKAPVRQRARWGVFDMAMKQVAIFDYNQRAAADQKVADLNALRKGQHFLQIVKDAMPERIP